MDTLPIFREPYRVLFPTAMAVGLGLIGLWGLQLWTGVAALRPADHGALLLWGAYGTAVLGFLGTAYPKQNGAEQPGASTIMVVAFAQLGMVSTWLAGQPLAAGVLGALTWGAAAAWAGRIARASLQRSWDPTTAGAPVALALGAGTLLLAGTGAEPALASALGVHAVLVPLALVLLDRILPFFSRKKHPDYDGLRRPWFVGPLLVLGLSRALAERYLAPALPIVDLALAALLARQWHGWRPLQGLRPPLLGVLHLGIAWLVLGYLVDALGPVLDLAPAAARHLWTVGGLGTLLLSISIRVARGHGGLPLALGWDGGLMILLVQVAVLLRGILPLLGVSHPALYPLAAAALAGSFLLWLLRLGPAMVR